MLLRIILLAFLAFYLYFQTKERESYAKSDEYTYVQISQGFVRYKLDHAAAQHQGKELIVCVGGLAAPLGNERGIKRKKVNLTHVKSRDMNSLKLLEMFSILHRELSPKYRVLRFDFLGRGRYCNSNSIIATNQPTNHLSIRSGFPIVLDPGPRGEMMIEQLVNILYSLKIHEEFHLVGVSMGG